MSPPGPSFIMSLNPPPIRVFALISPSSVTPFKTGLASIFSKLVTEIVFDDNDERLTASPSKSTGKRSVSNPSPPS